MTPAVRPTKSALDGAKIALPDIGEPLHEIDHPIVAKAQTIPEQHAGGRTERVVSLTDRVWFKARAGDWRAAITDLETHGLPSKLLTKRLSVHDAWWWLGAAGHRQDDSPQKDFYSQLKSQSFTGKKCSTDFMLPTEWDCRRLEAEVALSETLALQMTIRNAARQSLTNGDIRGFSVGSADVRVRVSVLPDGQAYVAVGAVDILDPNFYALIFNSFPGLDASEWLPEPNGAAGLVPAPGEMLYSALLPPDTQARLLESNA